MSYNPNKTTYQNNKPSYQVLGYGNNSSLYTTKSSTWRKTTCCGSFKFGQACTDCPQK